MRLTRVYVEAALAAGRRARLEGAAARHVGRVLRLRHADPLVLFDGRGGEYSAVVEEVDREAVWITALEHRPIERESNLRLTLAQGVSRAERMNWVVQKATELGVSRIVPILSERSIVKLDPEQAATKLLHWRSIVIGACEQSGRNRLPLIQAPEGLAELLGETAPSTRLLLSPEGLQSIADVTIQDAAVTVLIGPEGGLSSEERERAAHSGYISVRLGPRVLRTETAAVAALTVLQQRFGDL